MRLRPRAGTLPTVSGLPIDVAGERVILLPHRALYWPARRTLAVADLHWGKPETFQAFGLPIPSGVLADDLARLGAAVAATGAERLLLLGDLIHGRHGLTDRVIEEGAIWLAECPAQVLLVEGNHDAHVDALPSDWALPVLPELHDGPFCFRHEPESHPERFVWAGHVHPVAVLRGRRRRGSLRLPCFHIEAHRGILPAFSAFTGGGRLEAGQARRFAIAGDQVVPVQ